MRVRKAPLASQILVAVLGIVAVTLAAGLGLYIKVTSNTVDSQAKERAANIASTVGDMPSIASALEAGDPHKEIRRIAARVVADTGASYVVVIDPKGYRYSHPIPGLIGRRVEEPVVALDGRVHTGIDNGNLGRSANARAPVLDPATGKPVGEVSVGILETEVSARTHQVLTAIVLYTLLVLALAVVASWILARAIKRATFGLEPAEIVALVQEREAMLHGIREGVIGFDKDDRMNVISGEARRLLAVPSAHLGQQLADFMPGGRLRDILSGAVTGTDLVAVTDEHLLVLNRMPVRVSGQDAGWVTTIRDRTEFEAVLRQLHSVQGLTAALRAQEHEYSNRLHALSVLLELGEFDEATTYAGQLNSVAASAAEMVRAQIGPAVVAALLLAKITVAAERDVDVVLDPQSRLTDEGRDYRTLMTVLGNLVDNAVDAVADAPAVNPPHPKGRVSVEIYGHGQDVHLVVSDTGPGIAQDRLADVFKDGYTTKQPRGDIRRGVGLALVHRLVRLSGGTIAVTSPSGARFEVVLPLAEMEPSQ